MRPVQSRFMKPFEYGWKREVVKRQMGNARDVYYYTPSSQKLRSTREVDTFLWSYPFRDLTIENFSFSRQPLGIGDFRKECVRNATIRRKTKVKIENREPSTSGIQLRSSVSGLRPNLRSNTPGLTLNLRSRKPVSGLKSKSRRSGLIQRRMQKSDVVPVQPSCNICNECGCKHICIAVSYPPLQMLTRLRARRAAASIMEERCSPTSVPEEDMPDLDFKMEERCSPTSVPEEDMPDLDFKQEHSSCPTSVPEEDMPDLDFKVEPLKQLIGSIRIKNIENTFYTEEHTSSAVLVPQVTQNLDKSEHSGGIPVKPLWYMLPGEHPEDMKTEMSNEEYVDQQETPGNHLIKYYAWTIDSEHPFEYED